MPLKTSTYLKTASLRWSRKTKSRELLSVNMISLPLGDFRHLSHIGLDARGHHSFGDLSAFQSHQDLLQSAPPKPPRLLPATDEVQRRAAPPGHKKSHSLPLLDELEKIPPPRMGERSQEARGERSQEARGERTQEARGDQQEEEKEEEGGLRLKSEVTHNAAHLDEDPCCALSFDLGPSILDDVLQVMDRHQ